LPEKDLNRVVSPRSDFLTREPVRLPDESEARRISPQPPVSWSTPGGYFGREIPIGLKPVRQQNRPKMFATVYNCLKLHRHLGACSSQGGEFWGWRFFN
jgi:hypothetical protein